MSGKHRLFLGIVILTVMAALGGCQPKASQNEAAASPQAMATAGPAYQHRTFDSGDTEKTLRAIVSTLQDLDFVIGKVDVSRGTPVIAATMANAGGATGIAATVWQKTEFSLLPKSVSEVNATCGDVTPAWFFFVAI